MNPALGLQIAQTALNALPTLIALGVDITGFVEKTNAVLASGKDPTPEDFAALDAELEAGLAALKARISIASNVTLPAPAEEAGAPPQM